VTRDEYVSTVTRDEPDLNAWANTLYDIYDSNYNHRLQTDDIQTLYAKIDSDGILMIHLDSNIA